jgi:hypothetical protein
MPHVPFASSTRRVRSHFYRSRQREASYSRQKHRHLPQLCSFEEEGASRALFRHAKWMRPCADQSSHVDLRAACCSLHSALSSQHAPPRRYTLSLQQRLRQQRVVRRRRVHMCFLVRLPAPRPPAASKFNRNRSPDRHRSRHGGRR